MIKRDGDDALQKSLLERKYEDGDEHVSDVLRAKGGEIGEEEGGDTKGATVFQTGVNMLNELEGSGLLGLPYAAKLCGWASIGCMVLVGIMAGITGFVLAAAMYDGVGRREKKRVCSSYAEVGRRAFGQRGERAVLIVQMLNLIFVGVVYLVLVGNAMHSVYSIASDSTQDKRLWTSIAFLCAFPTVHFGGYRKVSLMSLLGIVCLTGIIVCGVGFSSKHIYEHGTSTMPKFDASHIFATASMFLFAYSAHGIFPDLEDSMARKEKFGQVVAVVFSTNIILKAAVTMTGVLAYGEATEQVLTGNLPHEVAVAVAILVSMNTLLSFPLPLIPVFRTMDAYRKPRSRFESAARRSAVVIFCGITAVALPSFPVAMGFMGSITLPFLTFIFPCGFYLKMFWHEISAARATCLIVIAALGAFGCVAGLISNTLLAIHGGG